MNPPSPGKRIVVCMDGTWNNPSTMRRREGGTAVLKPTNCLKMARAILPRHPDDGTPQLTYYDSGIGALGTYPGLANKAVRIVDRIAGGAWGAGFETNIEQAITFLANNHEPGDAVFVFGFSRGAAQARGLTRFLDWMGGVPAKADTYFIPLLFQHYLRSTGQGDASSVRTSSGKGPAPLTPVIVELLGVWDTVMSLGSRFWAGKGTSVKKRAFHTGPKPAECVRHARQALAVDEARFDFRPEIWTGVRDGQTLVQRWYPGAHTDVGGGQADDGLANGPFQWFLKEAAGLGLATDREFTKHYRAYPQDKLHPSAGLFYRIGELLRGKLGKGRRPLTDRPTEANLGLDVSVIHRLRGDPADAKHAHLTEAYRPKNVLELLSRHRDHLGQYLTDLGLPDQDPPLPADVMDML